MDGDKVELLYSLAATVKEEANRQSMVIRNNKSLQKVVKAEYPLQGDLR
jgi:hypothetical protein